MSSVLPTLLTVIIVAAGVIGTIFPVNRPIKWGIVSLIIVASVGTFFQSYQSNKDSAFLKGALSTMLASMPETPGFGDAIFDAAFAVAKSHGYYIPSVVKMGEGESLYFLAPDGADPKRIGAILRVGTILRGDLYVAYVGGSDIKPIFEQAIFGTDQSSTEFSSNENKAFLLDLAVLCQYTLGEELDRRHLHGSESETTDYNPPHIVCTATDKPNLALILDSEFIVGIKPMRHGERNAQAYVHLLDEVKNLPN